MADKHTPRFALTLAALLGLLAAGCARDRPLPEPGSDAYRDVVISFYTGLAAIQAGENLGAREEMERVTALAPGEPAGWANLGLMAHRQGEFAEARTYLERALELAPDDARILLLLARLESDEGSFDEALRLLRRAAEADPENPKVAFALAREVERQGGADAAAEVGRLLDRAIALRPANLALLLERVRVAALEGNAAAAGDALRRLDAEASGWPEEIRERLPALEAAAADGAWNDVATRVAMLRNVLLEDPAFRADLLAVQTPAAEVGDLVTAFVRLPPPDPRLAPPDTLAFEPRDFPGGPWTRAELLPLTNDAAPVLAAVDARGVHVEGTLLAVPDPASLPPHGLVALDVDADHRNDVAVAGPGGVRLFLQGDGGFRDVTAGAFPAGVAATAATGVWAADVDSEGDLDLVIGRPGAPPLALRNNGDGTFAIAEPFAAGEGLRDLAWADFDGDGDPDAALLDAGGAVHLLLNERRAVFAAVPAAAPLPPASALVAGDVEPGGALDLVVLTTGGDVIRLAPPADGGSAPWTSAPVARWEGADAPIEVGAARLFVEDLDNNGGLDLVATSSAGTRVWLRDVDGGLRAGPALDVPVASVADLDADGRLDLLARTPAGAARGLLNRGERDYHFQVLRPSALTQGDQRINSFGVGGLVEVRSGLLYQQRPVTGPSVHFGLGEHESTELVRIIWPNGDVQAEFDLAADAVVSTPQRLKGSCPWVFTFDGEGMRFVTDFIWRSPLGLSINAQETAGVMTTEDWVKIEGDELVPRDGYYDVRITAELWESHFFDHVSLLVVDHPADQEVFVDERFAFPPPPLAVQATAPPRPIAGARDDAGRDVTDLVRTEDGRYLGGFAPGRYQGVAETHYVEVDLGDDVPADGPLRLIASGWVRPTDSSINVALSQGAHAPPQGLSLEVPTADGGWRVAAEGLGFPSGKTKTILLDLEGLFPPGAPRRLRLRTNLEVYWDAIGWTVARPADGVRTRRLVPETADLRYRGFSVVTQADRTAPELPDYDRLVGTAPRWRDLEGLYTRFGDVRELLQGIDDRYVIMNAGDELRFRFPALAPPPEGWTRDFVLVGDGWVKDGDLNTAFSRTVHPLPAHDRPAYDTPPGRLEDDPVFRRHPDDWVRYHTRYVAPDAFRRAIQLR